MLRLLLSPSLAILMARGFISELVNIAYRTTRVEQALEYVVEHAEENNPTSVLNALDDFSEKMFLINIGSEKGAIFDQTLKEKKPKVAMELGAYCGYSAIRAANLLDDDAQLISIEKSALNAAIATKMVEFAGLQHKVKIVIGTAETVIPKLKSKYGIEKVDFILIDHWKDRYLPDLKLLEGAHLLKKGSVIVADNTIIPGAPDYVEYVRNHPGYHSVSRKASVSKSIAVEDAMEISVVQEDF